MLHGINKNTVPLYHVINLIKKKKITKKIRYTANRGTHG